MEYCIYNSITTPDGTVLRCKYGHDYQSHTDNISHEWYMNDGLGYGIRRSVNVAPYTDNSVWIDVSRCFIFKDQQDLEEWQRLRKVQFWGTRGVDGKQAIKYISLEEMSDEHFKAILDTQHLNSSLLYFFGVEQKYRYYLKAQESTRK